MTQQEIDETPEMAENGEKRGRGRPSFAELEAVQAKQDMERRELELERGKLELERREIELERKANQMLADQLAAGRSQGVRNGNNGVRSEPVVSQGRTRKRQNDEVIDAYRFDTSQIPKGWTYEWKRYTLYGQTNSQYDVHMREQGFSAVPGERHPELVEEGHKGPIVRDGLMLMERPVELTREAMAQDRARAMDVVRENNAKLYGAPDGQLPRARANGTNEFNQIQKTYEAGIPVE